MRIPILVVALAVIPAPALGGSLEFDLRGHPIDPIRFRAEPPSQAALWQPGERGLRVATRQGDGGGPPTRLVSRFGIGGDFRLVLDYTIRELPTPGSAPDVAKDYDISNNIELLIPGAERFAIVYRNRRRSGDGMGYFAKSPGSPPSDRHLPAGGRFGRLGLARVKGTLSFLVADGEGDLGEIGSLAFGDRRLPEVAFGILRLNTSDAIDVEFTRLRIDAGEILPEGACSDSRLGLWAGIAAFHLAALAVALGLWWWHLSRGPMASPAAWPPAS